MTERSLQEQIDASVAAALRAIETKDEQPFRLDDDEEITIVVIRPVRPA